ncbi:MAG: GDSL-type esterase/lipase family protein [Bacteroidota bacterium]
MKKVLLFIILCSIGSFAQRTIVNSFQKQLVFDGNSLFNRSTSNTTSGFGAPLACYSAMTGTKPPISYYALGGRTVAQLITEFGTKIAPYIHPNDIVVFNEATNSLQGLQNPDSVYNQIIRYRNLVRAKGAKIIVLTLTARTTAAGYANFEIDRLYLNNLINTGGAFDGICDTGNDSHFNSPVAALSATYYDPDGLHFTSTGYTLYGQLIQATIQSFF